MRRHIYRCKMPLVKRDIEPQYISRVVVPPGVRNELEFVANATLGHVVAQLSSLSKHAEDLFSELHRDTSCIFYRSCKLNERIDRLKQKIQQLNPVVETGETFRFLRWSQSGPTVGTGARVLPVPTPELFFADFSPWQKAKSCNDTNIYKECHHFFQLF